MGNHGIYHNGELIDQYDDEDTDVTDEYDADFEAGALAEQIAERLRDGFTDDREPF